MAGTRSRRNQLGLTAIDLFCGAGGLSEGFESAGFEVTFALDRDFDSTETYRLNHPTTKVEQASITDYSPKALARIAGEVDVILGGPSCQGFSTHGRRNSWHDPQDERNKLWRHMAHIVREIAPKAFLLENVPGLIYYKENRAGQTLIRRFEKLGYRCHQQVLLAADYGVPQLRRRVFVVGIRDDCDFAFPQPTHLGGWRRDTQLQWEEERKRRQLLRHITSWEAISDLPRLKGGLGSKSGRYGTAAPSPYATLLRKGRNELLDHEIRALGEAHARLVAHVPRGGTWRDIPPHLLPDRYRGMRRTDSTNLLGRIDPRRPAYTITTQFNNVTGGCFTHPYEDRSLSVREGARLQSFPDGYRFTGALSSRCRQIGNAVPPLLAQHLAYAIATAITGTPQRAKKPSVVRSVREATTSVTLPTTATRKQMVTQPRRDTGPELAVRQALQRSRLAFAANEKPLPELRREVDIIFRRDKVAVFIDGCFWHGCPEHTRDTKSNTKWWAEKITTNRERDAETTRLLENAGFAVVQVWEHEDPEIAAIRIERVVRSRKRAKSRKPAATRRR